MASITVALLLSSLVRQPSLARGFLIEKPSTSVRVETFTGRLPTLAAGFNPISSFVNDMASSLMGSTLDKNDDMDKSILKLDIASWSAIRTKLEELMETDEERNFRANLDKGYGTGSPLHRIRLFDESNKEEDIRVTFYRDSASWCPYCQKVWLTLEEKRIPYRVEKVNMSCYGSKPPSLLRIQPNGQIPVAIIDGVVHGQSNDILAVLESDFPEHKTLRPSAGQEEKAQRLLRLERQIFGAWMYWLTSGGGQSLQARFEASLEEVEKELSLQGPFFLGSEVSSVDFMFAPFLERMSASLAYFKGFVMRVAPGQSSKYPNVNKWFDAMEQLQSYQLTKSDYYTHCWDLPPQLGGCVSAAEASPYQLAINGERALEGARGSWNFPLESHNGGIEPDWTWTGDDAYNRREAVERLSANHEAIVKFACRGAGKKGMPPVSAPLADPNASCGDAAVIAVDSMLRLTCLAMLEHTDAYESAGGELAACITSQGGPDCTQAVIDSLAYLRDRVGVPRDMKLPAARQLRAHINWSIEKLLSKVK